MVHVAWISSRIALCNRTGTFPIPGEARHYIAAAAGGEHEHRFQGAGAECGLPDRMAAGLLSGSFTIGSVAGLRPAREPSLKLPDEIPAEIGSPARIPFLVRSCTRRSSRRVPSAQRLLLRKSYVSSLCACRLVLKLRSKFNSMIPPHWIEFVYVLRFKLRAKIGSNKRRVNDEA